jgi:hypothetical protein
MEVPMLLAFAGIYGVVLMIAEEREEGQWEYWGVEVVLLQKGT